jgi:hypothetical protein
MTLGFRTAAIVLTLLGSVDLAVAQSSSLSSPSMALELTPQQRTAVYQTVIRDKLRTPPPSNLPVTVGAQIPPATELYALPDAITADAPSAKLYKYTIAQNQVVIVDPTNLKVIDVIRP